MLSIPTILLAAGESKRLGHPKQLLPWGGSTLLRHTAETALASALGPVIVTLGAVELPCRQALYGLPVAVVTNPHWQEGMGGSIAAGMQLVTETLHRAVIILLCDQPAITPANLRALAQHQLASEASVVPCRFGPSLGPPVLFTSSHFSELRLLHGPQGARHLFQHAEAMQNAFPCAEAAWDIDTEGDLAALERFSSHPGFCSPAHQVVA